MHCCHWKYLGCQSLALQTQLWQLAAVQTRLVLQTRLLEAVRTLAPCPMLSLEMKSRYQCQPLVLCHQQSRLQLEKTWAQGEARKHMPQRHADC